MLKTIASLQGVSILSREAQKKISGGLAEAEAGASVSYTCFAQVNGQINAYMSDNLSTAANNASSAATGTGVAKVVQVPHGYKELLNFVNGTNMAVVKFYCGYIVFNIFKIVDSL
jgi:hypothetical protein